MSEKITNEYKKLFEERPISEKFDILRALEPTKLEIDDVTDVVDYVRSIARWPKLDVEFFGIFGTGGDRSKTINGSTPAAIVASCCIKVCKVGTMAVTSRWGSQNFIMQIEYPFTSEKSEMEKRLNKNGFLYMPTFLLGLPYDNNLIEARRMAFKNNIHDIIKVTVPGASLMDPKLQVMGLYSNEIASIVTQVFLHLHKDGVLIYNDMGIDELTNTTSNTILLIKDGKVRKEEVGLDEIGVRKASIEDIKERGSAEAQTIDVLKAMSSDCGPASDFIAMNAGLMLYASGYKKTLKEGYERAKEAINNSEVLSKLEAISPKTIKLMSK